LPTHINKYFDRDFLKSEEATRSAIIYKTEYLAQFAEVGSSYISERAIDAVSRVDYDYQVITGDKEKTYSLGVDWARYRDTAVIMLTSKHREFGNKKVEYIYTFDNKPFEEQLTMIEYVDTKLKERNKKGIDYLIPEEAGLGIPLCEQLKKRWRDKGRRGKVVPYSNKSIQEKINLYEEGKRNIENQEVQISKSAFKLINQLKLTTFEVTPKGHLTIRGGRTDDHSDAFCLSLQGLKRKRGIGIGIMR